MDLTADDLAWERIRRSGLVEPFASPVEVARALIGVQSQFIVPAGLAIRNRSDARLTALGLDAHLQDRRELIRLWGQRKTVHIYDTEDWAVIVSACRAIPSYRDRLTDLLDRDEAELEAALGRVEQILKGVERACRADLVAADASLRPWLEYGNMLLVDLARRGLACHAATVGSQSYFAHRNVWLPDIEWNPPSIDEAGRDLARRYFRNYGPATVSDFAFWLGARAGDAKAWASALGEELLQVPADGETMLDWAGGMGRVAPARPPRRDWPVRLLHRFDPMLLAYKNKGWLIDEERYKTVWRKAGYVEAVIFQAGRIAGTWGYKKKAGGIEIWLEPFTTPPKKTLAILEKEAAGVAAYFELPLVGIELR